MTKQIVFQIQSDHGTALGITHGTVEALPVVLPKSHRQKSIKPTAPTPTTEQAERAAVEFLRRIFR